MTKPDTLLSRLQALGVDVEYLREALRLMLELLMELEVSAAIEASPYERSNGRKAYRNGYRQRKWQTDLGEISLRIPKLRKGTYYPSFIDSLPDAEPLLLALVQDAYVQGVSLRSVEALLRRLGLTHVHQSQIADVAARLDDLIYRFRQRPLNSQYLYLWLDVLKLELRTEPAVSVVLAVGVRQNGQRDLLGFEVTSDAISRDLWTTFLRGLVRRGLKGVEVVVSENHDGLKQAIRDVFGDIAWQVRRQPARESAETREAVLVPAISTYLLPTREGARSPKASLYEVSAVDLLSAYTLISLKQALSRPADAVGMSLDEAAQLVGILLVMADALWKAAPPLHELRQSLAA
jgi:transposase-like protein